MGPGLSTRPGSEQLFRGCLLSSAGQGGPLCVSVRGVSHPAGASPLQGLSASSLSPAAVRGRFKKCKCDQFTAENYFR